MTLVACLPALFLVAPPPCTAPHLVLDAALEADAADVTLPAPAPAAAWRLAAADEEKKGGADEERRGEGKPKPKEVKPKAREPGSLDFDLLGEAAATRRVDENALRLRRRLLTWHQGVGLGMFALDLATTVVGQLNYDDKFGGANTAKYVQPHAVLAFSTLAAFAAAGTLAWLAPTPLPREGGFDRVTLHKLSMLTATLGMAAQAGLGIWAQSREGYLNQQGIATTHLVIGYVTLAAVAAGVSALVF